MTAPQDLAGSAAIAIRTSFLLALKDHKVLPESEIAGIVEDAAGAYTATPSGDRDARHAALAALITGILPDLRSVRRR